MAASNVLHRPCNGAFKERFPRDVNNEEQTIDEVANIERKSREKLASTTNSMIHFERLVG